ncbi:MAG TPA: hypothetical protein VFZ61_26410 [Polyangiales bacterium]
MSRYGVHRNVLLACVLAAAACTEPTFADRASETGAATPPDLDGSDAEHADWGNDEASQTDSGATADAAGSDASTDATSAVDAVGATTLPDSGSGLDGGAAQVPDAQLLDAQVLDAQPLDAQPLDAQLDAQTSVPDAETPPPDATVADPVPNWAKPLLGRFAKRSIYFAYDDTGSGGITATIDVSLVTVSATGSGQLELVGQQCSYDVHWSTGQASFLLLEPTTLPSVRQSLSLGQAPHFSSDTASLQMGFDSTRQSRCSPGASYADKYDDQSWITGSRCSCSNVPGVLPTEINDCRVSDTDGDRRPGVALDGTGFALDITAAINTTIKIADGEVRGDGEHVLREQRTRNVACLAGTCLPMNDQLCPGGETLMRPLPANATCADARAKVDPIAYPPVPSKDCRAK